MWSNDPLPGESPQVLPSPAHFEQLSALVDEDRAVEGHAVGNRVETFVGAVRPYVEAGFDEIYLEQIGPEQEGFFRFWERELLPALRRL